MAFGFSPQNFLNENPEIAVFSNPFGPTDALGINGPGYWQGLGYTNPNAVDKTPQKDTVNLSNKKQKRKKILIGSAIAAAAVTLIALVSKGKIKLKTGKKAGKKHSPEVIKRAKHINAIRKAKAKEAAKAAKQVTK